MSTTDSKELWNSIDQLAQDSNRFQFEAPKNESLGELSSVAEWFGHRVLRGYPAVFLVALISLLISANPAQLNVMACSVFWAVLVTLLLRPFSREQGGVGSVRLVLVAMLMVVLSPFLNLASALVFRRVETGFIQTELVAIYLQENLEHLLRLGSVAVLGVSILLTVVAQRRFEERFYWLEESGERIRPILAFVTPVLLVGVWMFFSLGHFRLSSPEQQWLAETKAKYDERRYSHLPRRSSDNHWEEFGQKVRSEEATFQMKLWTMHPPDSQRELDAVGFCLQKTARRSKDPDDLLNHAKFELESKPLLVTDVEWFSLLSSMHKSSGGEEQILQWLESVKVLRSEVLSIGDVMDLTAYHILQKDFFYTTYSKAPWPEMEMEKHDREHHKFQVRPLKVLGTTFPYSPTRLYLIGQRNRLTRHWLQVRAKLLNDPELTAVSRHEILDEIRKGYNDSTVGRKFWYSIGFENQVEEEAEILALLELILKIKLEILRSNELPENLDGLTDRPEAFHWELRGESGLEGRLRSKHGPATDFYFQVETR